MSKLPKYKDIIAEAITTLNEKAGSSSVAILKCSKSKHGNEIQEKRLKAQLKKMVKDGHLLQVKNSFKLANPKQYQAKKSFVKTAGLATKPKKLVSSKKVTGAADIIKKLNEDKGKPETPSKKETKSPAKPESKKKSSAKKSTSARKSSAKRSTTAKPKSASKNTPKSKKPSQAKAKSAPKSTPKGKPKKQASKPKASKAVAKPQKEAKASKKKDAPVKAKEVAKPKTSKAKGGAKAARAKKVAASGKGSQKK